MLGVVGVIAAWIRSPPGRTRDLYGRGALDVRVGV